MPGVHTGAAGALGSCVAVAVSTPMPALARAHAVSMSALTPTESLDDAPNSADAMAELTVLTTNRLLREALQLRLVVVNTAFVLKG
jgi:hypothetical protein